MMDIKTIQKLNQNYKDKGIVEEAMDDNPFLQFDCWFTEWVSLQEKGSNAMVLATANSRGVPSARTVLLKSYSPNGFIFYTDYRSQKMKDILENSSVALVFHWAMLSRDIRIVGKASKTNRKVSCEYFALRPRSSQISAWASSQSHGCQNRDQLEKMYNDCQKKFFSKKIPCPQHWGGVVVIPKNFEFWQGRSCRLHDRILYTQKKNNWIKQRLMP